jgi:hypothetical protein
MTEAKSIRIRCDFNKSLDYDVFSLDTVGAREDIAAVTTPLKPGMSVTLYDEDLDDHGRRTWLVMDAVIISVRTGIAARMKAGSLRHEPREA